MRNWTQTAKNIHQVKRFKPILMVLAFLFQGYSSAHVLDDWTARSSASMKTQIGNHWTVAGTYYLYLHDNISRYDRSVLGGDIKYQVNSWMKVGFNYRWGIQKAADYHDLRYYLYMEPKLKSDRWRFSFQTTLQQKLEKGEASDYFWRNKVKGAYKISKVLKLYAFTENYLRLNKSFGYYTQKSAVGSSFHIKKESDLEIQFTHLNKIKHKNYGRLEINYIYTFR